MGKRERERERVEKKRLDKKERTTKKNGLLRSLSRPHNSLSKNLRQSKPPLNGTPRQTGLARTATRATGLKNGQQPRVRATPYWPHHGNREGEGKEEGEGEQPLLDAARLFEDDPGSLPTATAKGPTHHSSLPNYHHLQQYQGQQA